MVSSPPPWLKSPVLAWICAISAYAVGLGALMTQDFQIVLFIRSLQNPAVEELGRLGNALGHGVTLVGLSGALLAIGYVKTHLPSLRAGVQGLVAHGLAGLVAQLIKHVVGRPRPRYAHRELWQWGPSLDGGFDAFPSGHSAASFAVATVLAAHFPRGKWLWYGGAAFVASSRVLKGSHFPSDVFAGALIGYLLGCLVAQGVRDGVHEWRMVLLRSIVQAFPWFLGGFAWLWITFHEPAHDLSGSVMMGMGVIALLGGLWLRAHARFRDNRHGRQEAAVPNLLAGFGLVCSTASPLVLTVAITGGVAWTIWHRHHHDFADPLEPLPASQPASTEECGTFHRPRVQGPLRARLQGGGWYLVILVLFLALHGTRGLIPLH